MKRLNVTAIALYTGFGLFVAGATFNYLLASETEPEPTKPGLYTIAQSNDDTLCQDIESVINSDISAHGKIRFDELELFPKWKNVENLELDTLDYDPGDIQRLKIDIDNDGVEEDVYKLRSSVRGLKRESLEVFEPEKTKVFVDGVSLKDLFFEANVNIDFSKKSWLKLNQKGNYDEFGEWYFDGVAVVYPLRYKNETYIAANHAYAPPQLQAQFYVFQMLPDYKIKNLCMLEKICPGGHCLEHL